MTCPTPDQILDHLVGRLDDRRRDDFEAHIDGCPACRALLVELAHVDLQGAQSTPQRPRVSHPPMSQDLGRYEFGTVLGRGGMGEVRLAHDTRLDREVAVKSMRPELHSTEAVDRFVREARIQGGLEHPSVVPVHDLGLDGNGSPYLVMKRVTGRTMADLLPSSGVPPTDTWSSRQLLARLADVCLAIELAHQQGVVHRDLKPSNIMLGDFGEAYVLDWGLAKLAQDVSAAAAAAPSDLERDDACTIPTLAGKEFGTAGYMSPEQVRGEPIDARADVFALGCVLFEILTGIRAMPRDASWPEAALSARHHRPSERAPDTEIPPELDDLCARATSAERAERPSARQFAEVIQAYLDGDRDLERRRELAADHARHAESARDGGNDGARAEAMRQAGRALALDPSNETAQAVLGHLLLDDGGSMPAEALATADEERARTRRRVVAGASIAYFGFSLGIAALLLFPVRHSRALILLALMNGVMGVLTAVLSRRELPMRTRWYFVLLALTCGILALSCLLFGPLLVVPIYLISSLAVWLGLPTGYPAWITVVGHAASFVPVIALEALGALASTFHFDGRGVVLTPWVMDVPAAAAPVLLVVTFVLPCASTIIMVVGGRRAQEGAQNRLHALSWHLSQLLPSRNTQR